VVTQFGPLRRPAILLGALAMIVTGCTSGNDDTDPTFTPPTSTYKPPTSRSTSAAPTTTPPISTGPNVRPGEKPPTVPAQAKTNTDLGAELYARYWMQALDWGYATTDSSLAKAAFFSTCAGCTKFMQQFDGTRAQARHFRGGRIQILGTSLQPNDHHNQATAVYDLTSSQEALQVLTGSGKVVDSAPAIPKDVSRIWLRWTNDSWTVADWKEVVTK